MQGSGDASGSTGADADAIVAGGRTGWRSSGAATLGLASLGFVSLGLPEGALGVAWPSMRASFDLPLDALGLLLGTFASGYFVASALSGRSIARFGIGTLLAVSCAATGVSLFGYALAPAWPLLVALGGVLGLGAGTIDAALNTYAAVAHGPRVLNWMHAAFGLGAAVGPLLMTAIISSGLHWTIGYLVIAIAQLGLASGYALTRRRYAIAGASSAAGADGGARRAASDAPAGSLRPLLKQPRLWISLGLFFVYVGLEAGAGQWTFSLFTLSRQAPAALAGVLISTYWGSLTLGRLIFGALVTRVSLDRLMRACMLAAVASAALIWLGLPIVSWLALAILGLALAPMFPILIAETPRRLGSAQTANAVGFQMALAVAGGAIIPASLGVLAARLSLEVVGPCLVAAGLVLLVLHEALIRSAYEPPQSARSRSIAEVSFPPGA